MQNRGAVRYLLDHGAKRKPERPGTPWTNVMANDTGGGDKEIIRMLAEAQKRT
jgi:hypothetical protein